MDFKLSHHAIEKWIKIRSPKRKLTWEQSCIEIQKLLKKAVFKKILEKKKDDEKLFALYTSGSGGNKIRFIVAIHEFPYVITTVL